MANDDNIVMIPIPQQSGGQGVPIPSKNDRADLIEKIDPSHIVEVIRHRLLGEQFLNGAWVKNPALKKYALTERGAWDISNLMLGVSTINVSVGRSKEYRINQRLKRIAKTAQVMLIGNWLEYGLRDTSQQDFVHEIVFTNTQAVLFQSEDGSIQELMKATIYENRNIQSEKKEGMGTRLKKWLGV